MIFVTVGAQKQSFKRIIEYVEKMNLKNVIVQKGNTKYNGSLKNFDFVPKTEMDDYIKKSEYVITHGGITILELLKKNKKIIVVPREKKYKESISNHQFEICDELEQNGYILVARNFEEFKECVNKMENFIPKKYVNHDLSFYKKLEKIIEELL